MKKAPISKHKNEVEDVLKLNFVEGDISSIQPIDLSKTTRGEAVGKWLFEGLIRLGPDGKYELAGAKTVEISRCKKQYLFTLRANRYSDGSFVRAQDYEVAWKKALSPKSSCAKPHLFYCIKHAKEAKEGKFPVENIGVKALDDSVLLVTLTRPTDHFLSLLSMPLFAPYKEKGGEILCNGPFAVDQWKHRVALELKKNSFFGEQQVCV